MRQNQMKRQRTTHKTESGQILILIVGLIFGLIAITALIVDAGSVYGLRRAVQNAADNASLTAALALCQGSDPVAAGIDSAEDNGFNNDGTTNTVAVSNPPLTGPHSSGDDEDQYVEVLIINTYKPNLIQVLSSQSIETRARAVARCNPAGVADAQIILDGDDECSLRISGNGSYNVNGGGMHIDSLDNYAVCASGNAHLTADTEISIVGQYRRTGNAVISPSPTTGQTVYGDPLEDLEPPNNPYPTGSCTAVSVSGNNTRTINPGKYCNVTVSSNATLTMTPGDYYVQSIDVSGNAVLNMGAGIYFVDGGNFTVSGNADLDAEHVMIYVEDGDFDISGNGSLDITAPTSGPWQGMMLYMDQANSSTISISGNGHVGTTGTIYGHSSSFEVSGNGSNTVLNAQVIVNTMTISGNGTINQNFDAEDVFQGSSGAGKISLAE
jgi:hypothetical protein